MQKHLLRFTVLLVFITQQAISPMMVSGQAGGGLDDLDQYFEDYFEGDEDEESIFESSDTEEKEDVDFLSKKDPHPEPKEMSTEELAREEAMLEKLLELNGEAEETTEETKSVPIAEPPPLITEPEKSFEIAKGISEAKLETEIQEIRIALEELSGKSYLDEGEEETWNYEEMLQRRKEIEKTGTLSRVVDFLIGEEVERPTVISIDGTLATETPFEFRTLQESVVEATENHLPIEIAREKLLLYRRKINKAFRDLFPSVTASFTTQSRGLSEPATATKTHDTKLAVRQPIYQGGALWNKLREEKANLKAALAEYNKIFSDLTLEVATAYFNMSKAKTMMEYREGLVAKANRALVLSQEKFDADLISEIEHLNVQSQQSQIQASLLQSKEELELALLELQKSMNVDLDVPIDVFHLNNYFAEMGGYERLEDAYRAQNKKRTAGGEIDAVKINELIRMAYDNRPEFVIGEHKVKARKYAEKVEKAGWLPQSSIFVEVGRNREVLDFDLNVREGRWESEFRLGVEVSWNLWGNTVRNVYDNNQEPPKQTGFSNNGSGHYTQQNTIAFGLLDGLEQFVKVKEAEVATKEAILEFELSEKDMVSEVKESYYNYNRAKIQMRSVLKKIKYRQKLVELASHRSEINEIQISEYLQSEIDLVE